MLLYFARGTWCPTCRKWMEIIRGKMAELEKRGPKTVTVMAQQPERMKEYLDRQDYPFSVLADAKREVVRQYGVYVRVNFESINIAALRISSWTPRA